MSIKQLLVGMAFVSLGFAVTQPAYAQSDRDSILAVVQRFFDAIAQRDAALGRGVVLPDGQYYRLRENGDSLDMRRVTHREFIQNLSAGGGSMLERMWEPTVLQRGRMAVVWTPYDFYIEGEFSHCGVDAFSLIRTSDGWKVAGIMYTVEPTGCEPSPLGPPSGGREIRRLVRRDR